MTNRFAINKNNLFPLEAQEIVFSWRRGHGVLILCPRSLSAKATRAID